MGTPTTERQTPLATKQASSDGRRRRAVRGGERGWVWLMPRCAARGRSGRSCALGWADLPRGSHGRERTMTEEMT
jgi:hypothetical protein